MVFEWDPFKDKLNQEKYGISFEDAKEAFLDIKRLIIKDDKHSTKEKRFFCIGLTKEGILTVRFTIRDDKIRIFGAGYWREGKIRYEKEN